MTIHVLLVDDHPALRVGLHVLLEQDPEISVVGEVGDGREALLQVPALAPEVVVLDMQLPGLGGAEIAAEIRRRGLPARILALSSYADERYVRAMIEAGVAGYLLKDEAPERIVAAVRATARGEAWFSPSIAAHLAAWARGERRASASPLAGLTGREREILRLVAAGKANKEIAVALKLSEKTVEKHLTDLFAKLGVTSRVEAAVLAVREGLT